MRRGFQSPAAGALLTGTWSRCPQVPSADTGLALLQSSPAPQPSCAKLPGPGHPFQTHLGARPPPCACGKSCPLRGLRWLQRAVPSPPAAWPSSPGRSVPQRNCRANAITLTPKHTHSRPRPGRGVQEAARFPEQVQLRATPVTSVSPSFCFPKCSFRGILPPREEEPGETI